MTGEVLLSVCTYVLFAALLLHSILTRERRTTLLCVSMGLGFGLIFPFCHVNVFHSYSFHFQRQVLGLPYFLPFFWWNAFYISFWVAERSSAALPLSPRWTDGVTCLLAGSVMLTMETVWDHVAVRSKALSFQPMSYLWYAPDFHSGIAPQINAAHFVFGYVYAYTLARLKPISERTGVHRLLLAGLLMILSTFLVGLYFELLAFEIELSGKIAVLADVAVSLLVISAFLLQTPMLFNFIKRRILHERPG